MFLAWKAARFPHPEDWNTKWPRAWRNKRLTGKWVLTEWRSSPKFRPIYYMRCKKDWLRISQGWVTIVLACILLQGMALKRNNAQAQIIWTSNCNETPLALLITSQIQVSLATKSGKDVTNSNHQAWSKQYAWWQSRSEGLVATCQTPASFGRGSGPGLPGMRPRSRMPRDEGKRTAFKLHMQREAPATGTNGWQTPLFQKHWHAFLQPLRRR